MKEEQSDLLGGTDFKHSMEVRKKMVNITVIETRVRKLKKYKRNLI